MEKRETEHGSRRLGYSAWPLLSIALIVMALFFRFHNLEKKVYWHDEVFTSLWVSGYTVEEVNRQLPANTIITAADLQRFQHINENRTALSVISSMAVEYPEHPPLYFVLARLWAQIFGDSVLSLRTMSAIISVLVFPFIFWLGRELFEGTQASWIAVALVAVSPFHLLYAQEARQYGLLAVVILFSSAVLLRATRQQTKIDWCLYAAGVAVGLYTHLLFALVMLAHGLYIAFTNLHLFSFKALRVPRTVKLYALATFFGCLAFVPWFIAASEHLPLQRAASWFDESIGVSKLLKRWLFDFGSLFLDTGGPKIRLIYGINSRWIDLAHIPVVILESFGLYALCRYGERRTWAFILFLAGTTFLALALPDLIWGGQRSGVPRYMMASFLALELSVASLFALELNKNNGPRRLAWKCGLAATMLIGIVCCGINSQAAAWWNKGESSHNIRAARIINATNNPLVVSDFSGYGFANTISLGYLLGGEIRLQLTTEQDMPIDFYPDRTLFLFGSTESMRQRVEVSGHYRVEPTDDSTLWRLEAQ